MGEMEKKHECQFCEFYLDLPFASDNKFCMNQESEYNGCECNPTDSCDSWKAIEQHKTAMN
jgi:hypothetical protein